MLSHKLRKFGKFADNQICSHRWIDKMQKSESDEKCEKLGSNFDFPISATWRSTVKITPDEDQRWEIVDEETLVEKCNFEGEIYALDRQSRDF